MAKKRKTMVEQVTEPLPLTDAILLSMLKHQRATAAELARRLQRSAADVQAYLADMAERGILVAKIGKMWGIEKAPVPEDRGAFYTYNSRPDDTFVFGLVSDNHLGSKHARLDVLHWLYDEFAKRGVDRVFNCGNWIDGECRLNRHELRIHGLDGQCQYMVSNYPRRKGITTYAVTGDDHEGWFARDAQVDVGRHMEHLMRDAGRDDWKSLGYMESFVPFRNINSGKAAVGLVAHPGGGSAYAVSYKPQKLVESFAGGEKPGVLMIGHYHKAEYVLLRNVHCIQAGTTKDQDTFLRKHMIECALGGWIVTMRQDPRTGALWSCAPEWFGYYVRGYYNNRWNPYGEVCLPGRSRRAA